MDLTHARRIDVRVAAEALLDDLIPQLVAESQQTNQTHPETMVEAYGKAQRILQQALDTVKLREQSARPYQPDMRGE